MFEVEEQVEEKSDRVYVADVTVKKQLLKHADTSKGMKWMLKVDD